MYDYDLYEEINLSQKHCMNCKKGSDVHISHYDNLDINSQNLDKAVYIYWDEVDEKIQKTTHKRFYLEKDYDYKIEFNGNKDKNVDILLYVITYDKDNNKIYHENMTINSIKNISNINEGQYINIALRILGKGTASVKGIKIFRRKKIENLSKDELINLKYFTPKNIKKLKVACIFDPFTMNCYEDMCQLIKVDINTYKVDLEYNRPNILIVESAWKGNDGQWAKKIQHVNKYNIRNLEELINWSKQRKIPTIFWNKEDPVHYENFIEAAKLFDYVFTTDENSVVRYKTDLNHENVYTLPFAAQPKIHNPIKISEKREDKACFAGSFYRHKYEERGKNLKNILDIAINQIGVDIYDRNYNLGNPLYSFPERFNEYIKGYIPPGELDKVNKGYKVMININTVVDSPTMFSRRVFESLACGTPIVSSYSLGINKIFNGLVVSTDNTNELEKEFIKLKDKSYYEMKAVKGIREVLSNHTYYHRLKYILDKVGIYIENTETTVGIVGIVENIIDFNKLKSIYSNQEYKYKKLYAIVRDENLYGTIKKQDKNLNFILANKVNLSNNIKFEEEYISFVNLNNHYGHYYITDLVNATLYTEAEFIGKKSFFAVSNNKFRLINNNLNLKNENAEFIYTDFLDLDKCIVKNSVIVQYSLEQVIEYIYKNNINIFKFGYRYFSIDKFNFVENINKDVNLSRIDI